VLVQVANGEGKMAVGVLDVMQVSTGVFSPFPFDDQNDADA
jgi:hypothetical protein